MEKVLQLISGKKPNNLSLYATIENDSIKYSLKKPENKIHFGIEKSKFFELAKIHFPEFKTEERFKKPSYEELIGLAILFNDSVIDKKTLTNMVALAKLVIDRLYENGDVTIPSKKEEV